MHEYSWGAFHFQHDVNVDALKKVRSHAATRVPDAIKAELSDSGEVFRACWEN